MIDHGNYIPTPVVSGPEVLQVRDGEQARRTILLQHPEDVADFTGAVVGTDASLELIFIVLPGISAEIPLTVDLCGEHAQATLAGIYLASGAENADSVTFDIKMCHRVPNCTSRQLFNGLAAGSARCNFFGRIIVTPDAQQTEAYQENHNILLSEEARINTKPQLEIYADDVKCSHGATIGRLNEDEQFYMRSRGIPEEEAKVLQMISFVAPVVTRLEDPELIGRIEQEIRKLAKT
ncbi:MAG: SufD family Fe-S cluster assembly protein [Candidatus Cryptobacteroides sp.]|jgi:Fe-S cluster assembly protein SufD